jgi:hypothetical protein
MNNPSNSQAMPDQDDEMLAEYDFSQGVRGKYYDRDLAPKLPGVQFLKNARGQKTAVLLNLQMHRDLWQQVAGSDPSQMEFQYLTDAETHIQSVFLDFKTHLSLWQTLYDRLIA